MINILIFFFSEVTVGYRGGLPQLTVPLPSRRERCRFTLRPLGHTVGDLLEMLRAEDRGIDRAQVTTARGVRLSSSDTIESLFEEDFRLIVNDNEYFVKTPKQVNHYKTCLSSPVSLSKVKNI